MVAKALDALQRPTEPPSLGTNKVNVHVHVYTCIVVQCAMHIHVYMYMCAGAIRAWP